jgi:predicted dithiol-disulfide oxidoreductase (DUF899 family)
MTSYKGTTARLASYRRDIADIRKKMRELQREVEPEEVADYELTTLHGPARLSSMFGDSKDLIVVHSMGIACAYCTLWADGYNGIYDHLARRAAFVITGPDEPAEQHQLATARGWRFPMASHRGTTFAADLGYVSDRGRLLPGLSVFQRAGTRLIRVSNAMSEPGDDFCSLYHILDLLPDGPGAFKPR